MWRWNRALSLVLAVVLVGPTLLMGAEPATAGTNSWSTEVIPSAGDILAHGTDISDLAVASDNVTIYATDMEADKIYYSGDTGASWTELENPAGAAEPQLVAIAAALRRGFNVVGPVPPDSVFFRASQGEFDAVVAMYHDQGHIAIKALGIDNGVNITLGLPIIRTSVDHGTAFDKAGKGIANPRSLIEALRLANIMCKNR